MPLISIGLLLDGGEPCRENPREGPLAVQAPALGEGTQAEEVVGPVVSADAIAADGVHMGAAVEGVLAGLVVCAPAAAGGRVEGRRAQCEAAEVARVVERVSDGARGILQEGWYVAGPELARDHDQRGLVQLQRAGVADLGLPAVPRLRELGA